MTKSTIPIDVTDELRAKGGDFNDEDRVYEFNGHVVKVKTWHDLAASGHGREVFRVSGSECDELGKALVRESGPAVHALGRHLVVQSDSAVDLVKDIEQLRFACVRDTITAAEHAQAAKALTGVGYR